MNKNKEEFHIPIFVDWGLDNNSLFEELFNLLQDMPCVDQCPLSFQKEREDLLLYPNEEMIRRCLGRIPINIDFSKSFIKKMSTALDWRRRAICTT